jgi:Transcriptional regulators
MGHQRPSSKLAQTWCVLSLLHNKIESRTDKALQKACSISTREYSALALLEGHSCHSMRISDLSERLVLSHSATTRLINRMEERDLLRRIICDEDRRGFYVRITEKGCDLLTEAKPVNNLALQGALNEAAKNDELASLVALIQSL